MPFPLEIELDLSLAQMEHHVATYNGYSIKFLMSHVCLLYQCTSNFVPTQPNIIATKNLKK